EIAVRIDMRRLGLPRLPRHGVSIEDSPDRTAAVELGIVAVVPQRGVEEMIGVVELVPEPFAGLVDHDGLVPVGDGQTGGLAEMEDRAVELEVKAEIAPRA